MHVTAFGDRSRRRVFIALHDLEGIDLKRLYRDIDIVRDQHTLEGSALFHPTFSYSPALRSPRELGRQPLNAGIGCSVRDWSRSPMSRD